MSYPICGMILKWRKERKGGREEEKEAESGVGKRKKWGPSGLSCHLSFSITPLCEFSLPLLFSVYMICTIGLITLSISWLIWAKWYKLLHSSISWTEKILNKLGLTDEKWMQWNSHLLSKTDIENTFGFYWDRPGDGVILHPRKRWTFPSLQLVHNYSCKNYYLVKLAQDSISQWGGYWEKSENRRNKEWSPS